MTASLAAAALVGCAVALLVPPPPESRRRGGRPARLPGAAARSEVLRRLLPGRHPAPDLQPVVALVDRLAALVRAGLAPPVAWQHLAATPGPLRPVCALVAESVSTGGDAGAALRVAAQDLARVGPRRPRGLPAAAVVTWLGAAVAVSERTGAPLAACLERLAATVRAETAAADERAAALAGPQATAQVLGWLPAAGLLLGALVGANPLHALLATGPGRVCGAAGAVLWVAGRRWSAALVRAAARAGEHTAGAG